MKISPLKLLFAFILCFTLSYSAKAQLKYQTDRDSDPDTAWVSPNKNVASFAQYQLYPTPSRGKGTQGSFLIYLPEEYGKTNKHYPVIYYLHGGMATQREGQWLMQQMDNAIKSQTMPPVIIVSAQALPIGWYCNANTSANGVISGPVEDVLIKDLIPYIDSHYRTIADHRGRGLEGWSMGGFGAMRLAFKFPNVFGFASSIAGAVIDFQDEYNSLNLVNTFGHATGADAEKSIAYFKSIHPKLYAQQNTELIKKNVKIRLIVGTKDKLFAYKGKAITKNFCNYLDSLGIQNEYSVIKDVGHMIPIEYKKGTLNYPIRFWIDAFKDTNK